jgi:hypothetical protein
MEQKRARHILIAGTTFVGGFYFFLEFILPKKLLPKTVFGTDFDTFHTQLTQSVVLVGAMAIGLGVINLLRVHGGNIVRRRKGSFNSIALLTGLFLIFGVEIADFVNSEARLSAWQQFSTLKQYVEKIASDKPEAEVLTAKLTALEKSLTEISLSTKNPDSFLFAPRENREPKTEKFASELEQAKLQLEKANQQVSDTGTLHQENYTELAANFAGLTTLARELTEKNYNETTPKAVSHFLFNAFFVPLGSAMFSLLAFYVASAAYRSFRIRSKEALIMMVTALIVMLGQIPHGPLYVSESLPAIRNWILSNISTPAFRAIAIGSSVAGLAMAIRMWLSLEKSPLAVDDSAVDENGGAA